MISDRSSYEMRGFGVLTLFILLDKYDFRFRFRVFHSAAEFPGFPWKCLGYEYFRKGQGSRPERLFDFIPLREVNAHWRSWQIPIHSTLGVCNIIILFGDIWHGNWTVGTRRRWEMWLNIHYMLWHINIHVLFYLLDYKSSNMGCAK